MKYFSAFQASKDLTDFIAVNSFKINFKYFFVVKKYDIYFVQLNYALRCLDSLFFDEIFICF
jgi:hypothetical protein